MLCAEVRRILTTVVVDGLCVTTSERSPHSRQTTLGMTPASHQPTKDRAAQAVAEETFERRRQNEGHEDPARVTPASR